MSDNTFTDTDTMTFVPFPSIARLSRDMVITEKLDGTNAQVVVDGDGRVLAGSRTRWITPEADNYGFAQWVEDHADDLRGLGPGQHFGEWWGQGIQRKYGMIVKRFSLFNTGRWTDDPMRVGEKVTMPPPCCHVVPVLRVGVFDTAVVDATLAALARDGSAASPGFMKPEGIVVYHIASGQYFKKTLDKNDGHKSVAP